MSDNDETRYDDALVEFLERLAKYLRAGNSGLRSAAGTSGEPGAGLDAAALASRTAEPGSGQSARDDPHGVGGAPMFETGRDLDIAIVGPGFIAIQSPNGCVACSRAGNLAINVAGLLTDGRGRQVLGHCGPIALWRDARIEILGDGAINLRQPGGPPYAVDRILLLNPAPEDLVRTDDGSLQLREGVVPVADPSVKLLTGSLELTEPDPNGAMAKMIDLHRQFRTRRSSG